MSTRDFERFSWLACGGQGRRRSVDLRFFRPALNFCRMAVTRVYAACTVHGWSSVEHLRNTGFTPRTADPGHKGLRPRPILTRDERDVTLQPVDMACRAPPRNLCQHLSHKPRTFIRPVSLRDSSYPYGVRRGEANRVPRSKSWEKPARSQLATY